MDFDPFCVFLFQGSLLLNFRVCVFSFFYIALKFFYLLSLDSQREIVPIELPKPEETQIWEGENESVGYRQHLFLQLLLVIVAFI